MHAANGSKSFIEILEDEIRADLRREILGDLAEQAARAQAPSNTAAIHAAGRLETWLASHVGPVRFNTKRQPYGAPSKKTPPPPVTHLAQIRLAQSTEEIIAVELLSRHSGVMLMTSYTDDQLKTVWRKAALKTHPDRFVGADEITVLRATALFRELVAACELLSSNAASVAA